MTQQKGFFRRALSLFEGPVDKLVTRAKAWNAGPGLDLMQDPSRTFRTMRNLRNIYKAGGYISTGIDLYPLYTFGEWYTLEGDDETAKKNIEKFLDEINFNSITTALMVDAMVVRDGIGEIVMGRGAKGQVPVNIVVRPAECFEFDTETSGKVKSYTQKFDNRGNSIQPITLEPGQVLHYQFSLDPTSPYGVSLIERGLHDIKRDTRVIEATANGIVLHGTPKWHTKVNSTRPDAPPLSEENYNTMKEAFKDVGSMDNIFSEGDFVIDMKDTAGVPNVQQYSDVTMARVCAAIGAPAELLGLRQGTSDATAVSRIAAFYKQIKLIQKDIERLWNVEIIDKITGNPGLVKIKLNSASIDEFLKLAAAIAQLRTGMDPDAIADAAWCRERLGIPEDDGTRNKPGPLEQAPKDPTQLREWLMQQASPMPGSIAPTATDKQKLNSNQGQ